MSEDDAVGVAEEAAATASVPTEETTSSQPSSGSFQSAPTPIEPPPIEPPPPSPEPTPAPPRPTLRLADPEIDRVWIPRDARPTTAMLRDIFLEHPEWIGVIAYDEFRREVCKRLPAPWDEAGGDPWTNEDTSEARCWINDRLRANVPRDLIVEALGLVARRASYNSLADEIRSLRPRWDGLPRIETWTTAYLRAEDNPYHRDVGRRWILSTVARALAPGCKADHVLVLEAPLGGERKSSAIEALAGLSGSGDSYFDDSPIDLASTFAPAQLVGTWIYEIPELVMFKSFSSERSKQFLSEKIDRYSQKHERQKIAQPRMCVFAATTNKQRYLDDPNGRRTWPVRVGGKTAIEAITRDREQLFAECATILLPELIVPTRRGRRPYFDEPNVPVDKRWWLDDEGEARAREQQEMRYAADAWEEPISAWMDSAYSALDARGFTTVSEVLSKALGLRPAQWKRADEMRVAAILTDRFGWVKGSRRRGPAGGLVYPYYLPQQPEVDPAPPEAAADPGAVPEVGAAADLTDGPVNDGVGGDAGEPDPATAERSNVPT